MKITVQIAVESAPGQPEVTQQVARLETQFAALMSYGLSVQLLREVLPIGTTLNTMNLRWQVRHAAGRLEAELANKPSAFAEAVLPDQNALPQPASPSVVGLDGVHVHAKDQPSRTEGWFEVIVGKWLATEGQPAKCFGFVSRYDPQPKGRLFEWLDAQGLQSNQAITFLSDGGETVRELPLGLYPQSEQLRVLEPLPACRVTFWILEKQLPFSSVATMGLGNPGGDSNGCADENPVWP